MKIDVEVRSPFQSMILDVLWQFDTVEQCQQFRDSLPNQQQREICDAMMMMLIAAVWDVHVDKDTECEEANRVIDLVRSR